jgi:hypothetical protein
MSKQISTKTWLLTALLVGVGQPTTAVSFFCGAPVIKIGKDTGRNPVISVKVWRDPNGTWHVDHRLADKIFVYREQQYNMIDISKPDK